MIILLLAQMGGVLFAHIIYVYALRHSHNAVLIPKTFWTMVTFFGLLKFQFWHEKKVKLPLTYLNKPVHSSPKKSTGIFLRLWSEPSLFRDFKIGHLSELSIAK